MSLLNLTFERPTTSGYFRKKSGLLDVAPVDTPVLEFNLNGTFRGYRVLPSKTNEALRSEAIDALFWTRTGLNDSGTPPYVNVATAPNGAMTADKLIENTDTSARGASRGSVWTTDAKTASVHAKADERNLFYLGNGTSGHYAIFDLSTGAIVAQNGSTLLSAKITPDVDGWYRCEATVQLTTGTGTLAFGPLHTGTDIVYTGDGVSGLFVWGIQVETGLNASPYIPTTTTAVTTDPDIAYIDPATDVLSQGGGVIDFEWENPVEETIFLSDFEFTAIAGINKIRFEYSPTLIRLNHNGVQLTDISGTFDFTGMSRIEVGNFDGDLQPNNIHVRALTTGQPT